MKRWRMHTLLLAAGLVATLGAATACPTAADIAPGMLVGQWRIEWADTGRPRSEAPWVLVLAPHPEYSGSLKGTLSRGQERRLVVADWDDEVFTMEESQDGRRIAATWQATASQGRCGQELQGLRFTGSAPDASAQHFVMRR